MPEPAAGEHQAVVVAGLHSVTERSARLLVCALHPQQGYLVYLVLCPAHQNPAHENIRALIE